MRWQRKRHFFERKKSLNKDFSKNQKKRCFFFRKKHQKKQTKKQLKYLKKRTVYGII